MDPPSDGGPTGHAGWGRISVLRIGVAVLVATAAIAAWALTRGSAPSYRTSLVRTASVEATLDPVGTITPVNQADLAFNVSGKVSAVDVTVGSAVTAGQTVASLDPTALNASVVSAQATLAADQATLAAAEASQSTPVSTTPATPNGVPAATPTTTPSSRSGQPSPNAREIAQLQGTLVADQAQEDGDSSLASQTLDTATGLCEAPAPGTGSTTTTTTLPAGGGGSAPATCAGALTQASAARDRVSADIERVAADESALDAALQAAAGVAATGATTGTAASASTTALSTSTTAVVARDVSVPSSAGGSSRSPVATPQQLAVDQAAIDTAQAELTDAQRALEGVDLVSTISGTVALVSIAAGDQVTVGTGASPAEVVVIGPGSSYQLVAQVPVADIARVAVGQPATVTPDATGSRLPGTVTSIGVLPLSGSTGTTYPVTVSLTSSGLGPFSGADAAATIVVGRSDDVTAVPTSAVRTAGAAHLVTVVTGDTTKVVRVTLGTVGAVLTQVTSGVKPGEDVVLADLQRPIPTAPTGVTRFGGGLAGTGLGRAGFGGGGGSGAGGFGAGGLGGR